MKLKRIALDISEEDFKLLSEIAETEGRSVKKQSERMLIAAITDNKNKS